jgi:ABC-type polysaccharide/polyol phosphate export permease
MNLTIFKLYLIRELREKYLGNITGILWVFIQPVILLLMYWFVFEKIFQAKVSQDISVEFIVYLAIGLWPWLAFSESVVNAILGVKNNSDLIGKNSIDFKIPVIASITASYFINILGYIFVLIILSINFDYLKISSVSLLVIPIIQLYVFAIALGLFLSATQIFIKDTLQVMTTLMTLWFFLTPIIYSESLIPVQYLPYVQLNPLFTPISFIHKAVITHEALPWSGMAYLSLIIIILFVISIKYFNKLSVHFEDYK